MDQLRGARRAFALPGQRRGTPAPAGGSFWYLTGDPGPGPAAPRGSDAVDVAIIGGGFTGLWTAIALLEADPSLRVVVLEAERVGWGASGRNGGFCAASLTHGLHNGLLHFPDELERARGRGPAEPARSSSRSCADEGIDAELEETGTLDVATEPWQVDGLHEYVELAAAHGIALTFLDREAIQAQVHSPRFLAGVRGGPERCVMVNPAKLAWGLADGRRAARARVIARVVAGHGGCAGGPAGVEVAGRGRRDRRRRAR